MPKPGMMAMRRRRVAAGMFRHMVMERLDAGLGVNDLIVHKDLPRGLAERIVAEELKKGWVTPPGSPLEDFADLVGRIQNDAASVFRARRITMREVRELQALAERQGMTVPAVDEDT